MAHSKVETEDYTAEIIGYAEPWIVAPGDSVAIKVSTKARLIYSAGMTVAQDTLNLTHVYRCHARSSSTSIGQYA